MFKIIITSPAGKKLVLVLLIFILCISLGYNGFYSRVLRISTTASGTNSLSTKWTFSALGIPVSRAQTKLSVISKLDDDDETLLDLGKFKYIQNNENICGDTEPGDSLILVLVHSARDNFKSRKAIRDSYASQREYDANWKYRVVFLLGLPPAIPSVPFLSLNQDNLEDKDLQNEILQFDDIIVGNFIDTYRNMTYKHLMGYKWVLSFCNWATAVIRADDDMFIDLPKVSNFLIENQNVTSSLFCILMKDISPQREFYQKWAVTRKEYEFDTYPDYCLGAAYITRPNLIKRLYSVSSNFNYFWIDDVFVTGMLRTYLEVSDSKNSEIDVIDISDRFVFYKVNKTEKHWKSNWMFFLVPRKLVSAVMESLWKRTLLFPNV